MGLALLSEKYSALWGKPDDLDCSNFINIGWTDACFFVVLIGCVTVEGRNQMF